MSSIGAGGVTAAFQVLPSIPAKDCEAYRTAWKDLSGTNQTISGHTIAPWLVSLGFDRPILRSAWAAVDTGNEGEIDEAQFVVLMRLLQLLSAGAIPADGMTMSSLLLHAQVLTHNPLKQAAPVEPSAQHAAFTPLLSPQSAETAAGDDDFGDFGDFEEPHSGSQAVPAAAGSAAAVGVAEDNPFDVFPAEAVAALKDAVHNSGNPAPRPSTPAAVNLSAAFGGLLSPVVPPPSPVLPPLNGAGESGANSPKAGEATHLPPFTPEAATQVPVQDRQHDPSMAEEDDFGDFGDFETAAPALGGVGRVPATSHLTADVGQQPAEGATGGNVRFGGGGSAAGDPPIVPLLDMPAPLPRGDDEMTIITSISTVSSEVDSLARDVRYIEDVAHGREEGLRGTPGENCHTEHLVQYVQRLCKRADEVATRCLLRLDGIARTDDTRPLRKSEVQRVNQVSAPLKQLPQLASSRLQGLKQLPDAVEHSAHDVPAAVPAAATLDATLGGGSSRVQQQGTDTGAPMPTVPPPQTSPEQPQARVQQHTGPGEGDDFGDFGDFEQPPQQPPVAPPSPVQVPDLSLPQSFPSDTTAQAQAGATSQPEALVSRADLLAALIDDGAFVSAWQVEHSEEVFQDVAMKRTGSLQPSHTAADVLDMLSYLKQQLPPGVWARAVHIVGTHSLYAGLEKGQLPTDCTAEQLLLSLQATAQEDTWQACVACRRLTRLAALGFILQSAAQGGCGKIEPPSTPLLLQGLKPDSTGEHARGIVLFPLAAAAELRSAALKLRGAKPVAMLSSAAVASWVAWLDASTSLVLLSVTAMLTLFEAGFGAESGSSSNASGIWGVARSNWESLRSASTAVAPALLDVFERGTSAGCPVPPSAVQNAMWLLGMPELKDVASWSDTPPTPPSGANSQAASLSVRSSWTFCTAVLDNATLQPFSWDAHALTVGLPLGCKGGEGALEIDSIVLASTLEAAPTLLRRWSTGAEFSALISPPGVARFPAAVGTWRRLAGPLASAIACKGGAGAELLAFPEPCLVCSTGKQEQEQHDVWRFALGDTSTEASGGTDMGQFASSLHACRENLLQ